ncbi:hypothetical protein RHSIM_Rhsim12G0194100 [Rhododendron simsii]|uniref:Cytochrome P450 n=1 Tax=Rhododendron simsii TaxID=118357 RepID=A0A834G3A1_RHOSS|nr:hypothetical protein RHSIM_Rhsim12G0194100 [Rhododendron simsii]
MSKASSNPMPLSHNILPRVLSFYHHWKKIYGGTFLVWFGPTPRLTISDPVLIREVLNQKSDLFEKTDPPPHVRKLEGDGGTFLVWFGPTARLTISDPVLIREVLNQKSDLFEKTDPPPHVRKLEGDGLLTLKGEKWVHHRAIIAPAFYQNNLKLMIPVMWKSTEKMLEKWLEMSNSAAGTVEIEVSKWFKILTEEIITHTAFGSCSYEDGKSIFELQAQQMVFAIDSYSKVLIPGFRFFPSRKNRVSWRLDKEIKKSLTKLITKRINKAAHNNNSNNPTSDECPKDLLETMIKASVREEAANREGLNSRKYLSESASTMITVDDIVEECKTMFFAGKHTTSALLTWSTILLAMHPHWQELAREEVLRACGARDLPTRDDVAKLKTLGMILNESLRLYPPVVAILRRAKFDVDLGGCTIPCGTELLLPILPVHHDQSLWGHDATEFNPTRFASGVAHAAKHPAAFMPFGLGGRRCVGQNLAILQAKLAIAMILQRFSFDLAPSYQHAPTVVMLLNPQHGAPIMFRKL